jgi:apolipoprotein D and lipocalin family protein
MTMRALFALGCLVLLAACGKPPVNRDDAKPFGDVMAIDVPAYAGLWYEIARLPNQIEQDCEGVTAEYAQRPDGKLSVVNTCHEGAPDGKARVSKGVARIADPATNAKLKVSFFWPIEADYWVLGHAPDYSWSLVGEPSGRYLWILARTPTIGADLKDELIFRLQRRGYNTDALHWTAQAP